MFQEATSPAEDQPLLGKASVLPTYRGEPTQVRSVRSSEELGAQRTRPWMAVALQTIVVVLSLAIVALFVKAFIDADDIEFDWGNALQKALGGGVSGAAAMVLQVLTLMPLRTIVNYQHRYGSSSTKAVQTLYADGGWTRFYRGLPFALIQGPVSRFVDTAANVGILALLASNSVMRELPTLIKTLFASLVGASSRIILMPIDTVKTTLQTEGKDAIALLRARVKQHGITSLWYGALGAAAASFVDYYPWFGVYNLLDTQLPPSTTLLEKLLRSAFMGFAASLVSTCVSNSLRVLKTYRQVNASRISYVDAAREVIAVDGVKGLLGRGLKTRICSNILQSVLFSVLWKLFLDLWDEKTN